jgi:ferredoxin
MDARRKQMIRQIIKIDEALCNGCTLCVSACHEGAIGMVDGKAKLLRDDYCDGLGNCLPVCPTGAITFEQREAADFDEVAVAKHMATQPVIHQGCPGSQPRTMVKPSVTPPQTIKETPVSELNQWPVQLKLVPINAPYFNNANLLIAADCSAFTYGNFHQEFMKNRITLIGCPKLDDGDYSEKLTAILSHNNIKSVTIVRMEVPCCGGIEHAAKIALRDCGKMIPWQVFTLSTDGEIIN